MSPTPTPESIEHAADTLEQYSQKNVGVVDYQAAWAFPNCDTPACFAGHYLRARDKANHDNRGFFVDGAELLARDLGFVDKKAIELWAHANPRIWGNKHGLDVFYKPAAFGTTGGRITLNIIIAHLRAVAGRVREAAK